MADTKNVEFHKRPGSLSTLTPGRHGVETVVDPDLGIKMHGAQDLDGVVTKFIGKDKPARLASLETLDGEVNGINLDGVLTDISADDTIDGDGTTGNPIGVATSIPMPLDRGFEYTDTEKTGSTDKLSWNNKETSLVKTFEEISTTSIDSQGRISACDQFVFLSGENNTSGYDIVKWNRLTGRHIETVAQSGSRRGILCVGDKLLRFPNSGSDIREYNQFNLSQYDDIAASGLSNSIFDAVYNTVDGKIYAYDYVTNVLYSLTRGDTSYTVVAIRTIIEIVNSVRSIAINGDGDTIYLADFSSTTGSSYVRALNLSGVQQSVSSAMSIYDSLAFVGWSNRGHVVLKTALRTIYMSADLSSTPLDNSDLVSNSTCVIFDDMLNYVVDDVGKTVVPKLAKLSSLEITAPAHLNAASLYSSIFRSETYGDQSYLDWMRTTFGFNEYLSSPTTRLATYTSTPTFETEDIQISDENNLILISQECSSDAGRGHIFDVTDRILTSNNFKFFIKTENPFQGEVRVRYKSSPTYYLSVAADPNGFHQRQWEVHVNNGGITMVGSTVATEVHP